ncbi:MAG: nucleotidyl transferase AbiEii/AbiGii toxin family protein [Candidatus Peribacteraceae bacterium]|nr:nucleotidyl transferase AbiEii/AbiGii toxin family protein [Candidatus Peribacteraceae bacterium]
MESYEPLLHAFAKNRIHYLIVGGVAVNLHGYPRFTNDLDILLALDQENLKKMAELMDRMGYQQRLPVSIQELSDERKARIFIKEKDLTAYSFIHDKYPQFNVDVLVAQSIDFEKFAVHTMRAEIWGIDVPVVSIDDLIAMKKHSDREKDIQDIVALLELKGL